MINYTALKNECLTDPTAIGLTALWNAGADQAVADALNLVRAGFSVKRAYISGEEIFQQIDMLEMPALPGNPNSTALSQERRDLTWLECLANIPQLAILKPDGTNTIVATTLMRIFPSGTQTRARLVAIASRDGSRAEQLFGDGASVTAPDILKARTA